MAVRNLRPYPADSDEYTIDHLAQASGVTVRNIRAHQSRGLLPAPEVRGRTGFYTREHLDRLRLIAEMQADGFNLNAIKRILDNLPAGSAGQVLGFEQAIRQPWADEEPEVMQGDALRELGGDGGDDALLKKAIKLGLLVPLGEDRFEVPSPRLLAAGPELERLGVNLEARLAVLERIQKQTEGVAAAFIELFVEHIWKPFNDAGRPDEDWQRVHQALERLRPMATEVLLASFGQSMSRGVDEAFGRALEETVRQPTRRREAGAERGPAGGGRSRR
ncbi:MAG TPA: MerR family transcriptional regulator, partial [Candidatus Dormibacteraeota bacterium]